MSELQILKTEPEMYAYIASPLFHPTDLATIQRIEELLELHCVNYFSPRKEGGDLSELSPDERALAAKHIFDLNDEAILKCNLIIVNLDPTGKYPTPISDLGTVWEMGMAYGKKLSCPNQKILTFGTKGQKCNIMMAFSTDCHLTSLDKVEEFLGRWLMIDEDYDSLCKEFHNPHGDME